MSLPLRQLCAALLVAAACRGPSPERRVVDTSKGEVAFDLAGPGGAVLVVPVYINGSGPYDFVLDTGATLTCVDQTLEAALKLPARFGPLGIGAGVAGTGQVRIVRIDSIRTGSAGEQRLDACVLDLQHLRAFGPKVQGLLGLNFLKDYKVGLDFERKVVTFAK
jgi:predicted aspartyl protease